MLRWLRPALWLRWLSAILIGVAGSAVARADYEGTVFGVERFSGRCGGGDRFNTIPSAQGFANGIDFLGYDQLEENYDLDVDGRDFTDRSFASWGADYIDPTGTDFADVVYISSHGGYSCSPNYYTWIVMGDNNGETTDTCRPRMTRQGVGGSSHVLFADGGAGEEANVMVIRASAVLEYCVFNQGKFIDIDQQFSGNQFTTLLGFHGSPQDNDDFSYLQEYVGDAAYNGIGDDWVDRFTDLRSGGDNDDCAVAVAFGANAASTDDMFYNGGYLDFRDTGSLHNYQRYYFICGCDPSEGQALNIGTCP